MARKSRRTAAVKGRQLLYVTAGFFAAEWAVMFALWLLLVDNLQRGDLLLGLAASLIAAAATSVLQAANFARFAPHAGELAQAWRLPWYLLRGTWEIFVVLAKHLTGKRAPSLFVSIDFDAGGDDAHSAGRRALAVALMTVPPDCIAIGIDCQKQQLVLHEFHVGSVPIMAQKLGGEAMNFWLLAALLMIVALVPCGIVCFRGSPIDRLVGLEMADTLCALLMLLLAEGFHRLPFYDLAVALALLAFGSGLVFVRFLERYL